MNVTDFRDVTPCGLVKVHRHVRENFLLQPTLRNNTQERTSQLRSGEYQKPHSVVWFTNCLLLHYGLCLGTIRSTFISNEYQILIKTSQDTQDGEYRLTMYSLMSKMSDEITEQTKIKMSFWNIDFFAVTSILNCSVMWHIFSSNWDYFTPQCFVGFE
jgi:hypothetical protein